MSGPRKRGSSIGQRSFSFSRETHFIGLSREPCQEHCSPGDYLLCLLKPAGRIAHGHDLDLPLVFQYFIDVGRFFQSICHIGSGTWGKQVMRDIGADVSLIAVCTETKSDSILSAR